MTQRSTTSADGERRDAARPVENLRNRRTQTERGYVDHVHRSSRPTRGLCALRTLGNQAKGCLHRLRRYRPRWAAWTRAPLRRWLSNHLVRPSAVFHLSISAFRLRRQRTGIVHCGSDDHRGPVNGRAQQVVAGRTVEGLILSPQGAGGKSHPICCDGDGLCTSSMPQAARAPGAGLHGDNAHRRSSASRDRHLCATPSTMEIR